MSGGLFVIHVLSLQELVADFRNILTNVLKPSTLGDIIEVRPILLDQLNDFFNGAIPEEMKVDSTSSILSNYRIPTDVSDHIIELMQGTLDRHTQQAFGGVKEYVRYDFYIKNETTLVIRDHGDRRLEEYYNMKREKVEATLNHGDPMDSLIAVGP